MKKLFGGLLLLIGIAICLDDIGGLLVLLLTGALMVYGLKRWKRATTEGQKVVAVLVMGVAALLLFRWFPSVVGLLIGGVLFYLGWKVFNGGLSISLEKVTAPRTPTNDTSFDADWRAFMDKQNKQ
ncbi:hypothetical protein CLV36_105203 [Laceyella sediminis]|jgi:hypothetical protein|uniref:Lia operon protein LiaI n=1 Tax=Laceyella sediminis TaxID=573074 RepID=A0ABX5EPP5_9BACL|nr:hypothetical protein [Laceyella sediminis]PRZ14887.1 hypothetical protein CLV36_105203 [Laceyella sediminis]